MTLVQTLVVFGAKDLLYLLVLAFAAFVVWRWKKLKRDFWEYAVGSGALSLALSLVGGALYWNPRPFVSDGVTPLFAHAADNGFPSDHTLLTSWLAAAVFPYNRPLGVALAVGAVLVGASRVWAGVHHPVDIIGSLVIVAFSAWFVRRVQRGLRRRGDRKGSPA